MVLAVASNPRWRSAEPRGSIYRPPTLAMDADVDKDVSWKEIRANRADRAGVTHCLARPRREHLVALPLKVLSSDIFAPSLGVDDKPPPAVSGIVYRQRTTPHAVRLR
jgi:hypothetical protein